MQNPSISKKYYYLNKLALTTGSNTDAFDPYSIIKDFFYSGTATEMKDLFLETCRAALSEKYSWKEGSPGNLFYFYDKLERLVEACFLLFVNKKYKNKPPKKIKPASKKDWIKTVCLPCSLSRNEISNPFSVIQSFFEFQTIKQWKQDMYAWLEAGLSNYTVLSSVEAKEVFYYHYHLQKLLDACWYISLQYHSKKN